MKDRKVNELLAAYRVPDATPAQLEVVAKRASATMTSARGTKPFSIFAQLRVQATYLSKWFYVSSAVLIACCLVVNHYAGMRYQSSLFFSFGPLFILPGASSIYRLFADNMYELEASCKYSFAKILTGKLLLLSLCATVSLAVLWLMVAASTDIWAIQHVLLALVSFSVTCCVILCFGKRSMLRGLIAGGLWAGAVIAFSLWNKGRIIMETMSIGGVVLILFGTLCMAVYMAYRFLKNLSIEEGSLWNYALTE